MNTTQDQTREQHVAAVMQSVHEGTYRETAARIDGAVDNLLPVVLEPQRIWTPRLTEQFFADHSNEKHDPREHWADTIHADRDDLLRRGCPNSGVDCEE